MEEINSKLISEIISKELVNNNYDINSLLDNNTDPSAKNIMFEQYKLLIDSFHKIEERRSGSNSVFIGLNTILFSVLANSKNLATADIDIYYMPFLVALSIIGIFISYDWLKVINSYKKLNFLNYAMIQSFEKLLPTSVFSLRAKLAAEYHKEQVKNRGSSVLLNEQVLPKVCLFIYSLCIVAVAIVFCYKLYCFFLGAPHFVR